MKATVGEASIAYGNFIQNVIDFLIIAFCIFVFIRVVSKFNRKPEEVVVEEVKKDEKVELLEKYLLIIFFQKRYYFSIYEYGRMVNDRINCRISRKPERG